MPALNDLPEVIGATVEEAATILLPHGINAVRATIIDGRPQICTQDMRSDRLNVSLLAGEIKSLISIR